MNSFIKGCRDFPMPVAIKIVGVSGTILLIEAVILPGMVFQPGWANGWGVSKHSVFAGMMSGALFLTLACVAAAVFSVPCSLLQQSLKRNYVGWGAFASLMLLCAVLAAILSADVFPVVRDSIAKEWR